MINTKDYRKFMRNMVSKVRRQTNDSMFEFAVKTFDKLRDESIKNGINFDGIDGKKTTYSDKKIPSWMRAKYILNSAGAYSVKFIPMQSWGDFRKGQGLKSKYVNLSYTGEHWDSYTTISSHTKIYTVFFGDANIMSSLEERYGDFYDIPDRVLKSFQESILRIKFHESINKNL